MNNLIRVLRPYKGGSTRWKWVRPEGQKPQTVTQLSILRLKSAREKDKCPIAQLVEHRIVNPKVKS